MTHQPLLRASLLLPLLFAACAPTLRLDTPEPVKIDVHMKVDVTTSSSSSGAPASSSTTNPPNPPNPQERRRLRMAEVQTLKNDRRIGEANNGLLKLLHPPEDKDYLQWTQSVVADENTDRQAIFQSQANLEKKPLEVIASEFAERARGSAFPGEWVQLPDGKWKQL